MSRKFRFALLLAVAFPLFSASAEPKSFAQLFPLLPNIDDTKVFARNTPEYVSLRNCQFAENKATGCVNIGDIPRLYDFAAVVPPGTPPPVVDSFDILNRCIGVRFGARYSKGFVQLSKAGVNCPTEPDEVVMAQIAICYQRMSGAFCSFATACFEGANARGQCVKDYVAEEIFATGVGRH